MNTADGGGGSLRAAIDAANVTAGPDSISFSIPGSGVQTISVTTQLPEITDRVTIDGTTQPGYAGKPLITLNNGSLGSISGLRIRANGCLIRGLSIGNFSSAYGILIFGASNTVQNCFVGTDASGKIARPNFIGVLTTFGSSYTTVGGPGGVGNVVSGNLDLGVCLFSFSSNHIVQGNFIGTDLTGTNRLANGNDGVSIDHVHHCTVGGTEAGEGNLISGNGRDGIRIIDSSGAAYANVIQGNFIGLDVNGTKSLPNSLAGITVFGPNNTIGGSEPGARNVISGNLSNGILIQGGFAEGNVVEGNIIGLNVPGTLAVPNLYDGIQLLQANANTIGGTTAGAGNVISGNRHFGINLTGDANVVQGNFIGTDPAGMLSAPNGVGFTDGGGVRVSGALNTVGGELAEARNIISGNTHNGIVLAAATNCVVQANWVGVDAAGRALGNSENGIVLDGGEGCTLGGLEAGQTNIVSANGAAGILLTGAGTIGNFLQGNLVGVAPDGRTIRGNIGSGIVISNVASENFVGVTGGEGNIVSGNGGAGVQVTGAQTFFNTINGNLIGLDATGQIPAPNAGPGIEVSSSAEATYIGGDSSDGNRIAFNRGDGVRVLGSGTMGVSISANSIYANGGLGINLQPDDEAPGTVTPNDLLDADSGPNHLQNFPVITNVVYAGGLTVISGYVRSTPNGDFDVQIFANHSYEDLGYGEGQTYLGSTDASSSVSGFAEFQFVATGSFGSQPFTATATSVNPHETSEFSRAVPTLEGLLRITEIRRDGADIRISFTTRSGVNYRVEATSSLGSPISWNPVAGASSIPGTGGVLTVTDSGAAGTSPHFYQVREL